MIVEHGKVEFRASPAETHNMITGLGESVLTEYACEIVFNDAHCPFVLYHNYMGWALRTLCLCNSLTFRGGHYTYCGRCDVALMVSMLNTEEELQQTRERLDAWLGALLPLSPLDSIGEAIFVVNCVELLIANAQIEATL